MIQNEVLKTILSRGVDFYYSQRPRFSPDKTKLQECKIVSHRGDYDNITVLENTISAFDRAIQYGVWGIECDIRWTKDLYPVVIHDSDLARLFGQNDRIKDVTLKELQGLAPHVPTLEDLVRRYGGKTHLMIEVKKEHFPRPDHQKRRLSEVLSPLTPCTHFHLLSLHLESLHLFDSIPKEAMILVAETNTEIISKKVLENGLGGIAGHYFLLSSSKVARHKMEKQKVGTGFISSRNCLFREIYRGIDWVFTNESKKLMAVIGRALDS